MYVGNARFPNTNIATFSLVKFCICNYVHNTVQKIRTNICNIIDRIITNFYYIDQVLHQLTARAIIRDWTDGSLDADRTQHEVSKFSIKLIIMDMFVHTYIHATLAWCVCSMYTCVYIYRIAGYFP